MRGGKATTRTRSRYGVSSRAHFCAGTDTLHDLCAGTRLIAMTVAPKTLLGVQKVKVGMIVRLLSNFGPMRETDAVLAMVVSTTCGITATSYHIRKTAHRLDCEVFTSF